MSRSLMDKSYFFIHIFLGVLMETIVRLEIVMVTKFGNRVFEPRSARVFSDCQIYK